jgi:ankyrin repeat protein
LQIAIAPDKDKRGRLTIHHDEYFKVRLTNRSAKLIRLWAESCRPGYDTLTFRITEEAGNSWMMRKRPDDYWDDYPLKTIAIAPGATYVLRVVPRRIQRPWSWTGMLEPNSGEDVTIVPVFEIKADAQTREHGVWTGHVEGQAVKVRVVNPNLTTPQQYLWNQCPRQALKIMQANPKWINEKEENWTALHAAAEYGFVEVVDWLLANGADVDARGNNDSSPLDFATEPSVVRAILRHKPKDKDRALAFFQSPLEHAAEQVAEGGPDAKKWREIVALMLDAGAPYSLNVAAYLNDITRVRQALKEDPGLVNLAGARYKPLRIAARLGRNEICKVLLEHKGDPDDWGNGLGFPILVDAIKHPAVVKLLLAARADVKTRISWRAGRTGVWIIGDKATGLHFAAQHGALESAKLLLDAGVDVSAKDTYGQTALDVAARSQQGDVAHLLASRMGTAEARDTGWRTLLHQLVFSRQEGRLKRVLQEKAAAGVFAQEASAFMESAADAVRVAETKTEEKDNERYLAVIKLLHARGIPIDLYSAITSDNVARVKELLKADPSLIKRGRPVLERAVILDRQECVVLLLNAGADANEPDAGGYTALHKAAFWNRPEIAKLLIEHRADVNACTIGGVTPLHEAAERGSVAVVRHLLAAGAKVSATDNEGRTPLNCAADFGEGAEVIDLLIRRKK